MADPQTTRQKFDWSREEWVDVAPDDFSIWTRPGPAIACRICGYTHADLRKMVQPGQCNIASQWDQPAEKCFANSADFALEPSNV